MKMQQNPESTDSSDMVGNCDSCGAKIYRYRGEGDLVCDTPKCPAIYNSGGQRLRDDLFSRPNPSEHDDDIGDMEGYELAMLMGEDE